MNANAEIPKDLLTAPKTMEEMNDIVNKLSKLLADENCSLYDCMGALCYLSQAVIEEIYRVEHAEARPMWNKVDKILRAFMDKLEGD